MPSAHGFCVENRVEMGQKCPLGHTPRTFVWYASMAPAAHQSPGGHSKHASACETPPVTLPKDPAGHSVMEYGGDVGE
jgi:hypothetical protein